MELKRFRWRMIASLVGLASLLLLMLGVIFWRELRSIQAVEATKSQTLIDLQREILAKDLEAVHSDVQFLARQPETIEFVERGMAESTALVEQLLEFSAAKRIYDQIRLIGNDGFEHIRINYLDGSPQHVDTPELQFKGDRYYIEQAQRLARGDVYVSPFDLNLENGKIQVPIKPMIRFVAPVFNRQDGRAGWIVLNFLGQRLLHQLRDSALGFPGRTLLVNAEGEYILAPTPDEAWGWMLGHGRNFRSQFPRVWERMVASPTGRLSAGDGWVTYQRFDPSLATGAQGGESLANHLYLVSYVSRSDLVEQLRPLWTSLLMIWLAMLIPLAVLSFYLARTTEIRRQQATEIAQSEQRLRQLSTELMNAQELERKKVARDLHDDFGQQITAIIIELERARSKVSDPASSELIDRLIADARQMLENMHRIVRNLRPLELDDLSLSQAIASLAAEFEERQGLTVELDLASADSVPASPRVKENLFRIVQESLTNVAAHAGTPTVAVHLSRENQGWYLRVADRGGGFQPEERSSGFGLLGMRERAELLGGRFAILTEIGKGTTIDVWIPQDEAAAK